MANKITVKFEAQGARALKSAIDQLAVAQTRLTKGTKKAELLQKKLNRELEKYGGKAAPLAIRNNRLLNNSFATLRSKLLLVSFGFGLINATVLKLGKQYGEQEQAERRLANVIGKSSDRLAAHASELQKVTRFGDEETLAAMTLVGAYTTNEQAIASLTEAAMDLATVKGMDLKSATDMLSKSVFSSTNSMNRYGITIEGTAGSSDRLNSALKTVSGQMGGASEEDAKTFLGALDQMGDAIGDLGEDFGAVLAPAIVVTAKAIKSFAEAIDEEKIKSYGTAIIGVAGIYGTYTLWTNRAALATLSFSKALKLSGIGLAIGATGFLIDKLNIFGDESEEVKSQVDALNKALEGNTNLAKDSTIADREAFEARRKLSIAVEKLSNAQDIHDGIVEHGLQFDVEKINLEWQLAEASRAVKELQDKKNQQLLTEQERKEYDILLNEKLIAQEKARTAQVIKDMKDREASANKMIQVSGNVAKAFAKDAETAKAVDFGIMMVNAFKTASNTYALLSKTYSPPIPGLVAAAEFAATAALATQAQKFEQGGLIGGRRHAQGGTMIEAERGEFVMSRDAVDSIGVNNLQAMNSGRGGASIVINNPIISSEFVESELPELISEAVRKGADFGMS